MAADRFGKDTPQGAPPERLVIDDCEDCPCAYRNEGAEVHVCGFVDRPLDDANGAAWPTVPHWCRLRDRRGGVQLVLSLKVLP